MGDRTDHGQVLHRGAHVNARDIGAAQAVHEPAERPQLGLTAAVGVWVDRLVILQEN